MIGDGLNDVLSLQQACVGVSINAKSELNLVASDVIVLNENLWSIVILLELMRISNLYVYINLIWAFSYNIFIARKILYIIFSNRSWCILFSGIYCITHDIICGYVGVINYCGSHKPYYEIY